MGVFQKQLAVEQLKADDVSRPTPRLMAELRQADESAQMLRRQAESEEEILRALDAEARAKGDAVEDLLCAITASPSHSAQNGSAENGHSLSASDQAQESRLRNLKDELKKELRAELKAEFMEAMVSAPPIVQHLLAC